MTYQEGLPATDRRNIPSILFIYTREDLHDLQSRSRDASPVEPVMAKADQGEGNNVAKGIMKEEGS